MGVLRYLLVIVLAMLLAILTIAEHVERTRLGYAVRSLETERAQLLEEEKAARLAYEQAIVPEQLVTRAIELRVATPGELTPFVGSGR